MEAVFLLFSGCGKLENCDATLNPGTQTVTFLVIINYVIYFLGVTIQDPDGENYWRTPAQFRRRKSYLTSRLCEKLMGNSERRPVIALFSISWKLIRPKAFYWAQCEHKAAVWRQTAENTKIWTRSEQKPESVRPISLWVRFWAPESQNMWMNVNLFVIRTPQLPGNTK